MEEKDFNRKRLEKIQSEMEQQGLEALFVFKSQNSFYVSRFNPVIQSTPVITIISSKGEPALLLSCLRANHAREDSWIRHTYLYGRPWMGLVPMAPGYLEALEQIVIERGWSNARIGVEKDYLSVRDHNRIKEMVPGVNWVDSSPLFEKVRLIKDDQEIDCLRIAATLADRGMKAALEMIREGVTEQEITFRAQQTMNEMWLKQFPHIELSGFATQEGSVKNDLSAYCLSGPRWEMACDSPTDRKIGSGELVFFYASGVCNGYHAENERTVAVGKLNDEQKKVYDTILEARELAKKKLRPGVLCSEVYHTAIEVLKKNGYGNALPGRIGHGMGLGEHEEPSLGPNIMSPLQPGMVVTFEPSMKIGPLGGAQHSDTVLITSEGFEFLTKTERGFLKA
jgi:Xaa-Pro dipeptidase